MDSDRRQSIRVTANLPCQWQIIAADSSKEALLKELGLPSNFAQTGKLTQLSEELADTLHRIEDDTVRAALTLLDQKLELLTRQNFNQHMPPKQQVGLSAEGLTVKSDTQVPVGTTVAVHLVLDHNFPLIELGEVTRCNASERQYVVGIKLTQLQDYNARRLARFVMRLPTADHS